MELKNLSVNYRLKNPKAPTSALRNKLFLLKQENPPHQSLESATPSLAQPAHQKTKPRTKTRTRTSIRTKIIIRIKVKITTRTIMRTYGFIAK